MNNSKCCLEVSNIRVAGKTDLLIDITLGYDFIGAGRSGHTQSRLRNPDNPDLILESAASDKIRTYRAPYQLNRQVVFLPACMSTSGRIHGEFLRLLFFLSTSKPTITLPLLVTRHTRRSFVTTVVSSFDRNRCTIGLACAQAVSLRGAPTFARRSTFLYLAGQVVGEVRAGGSSG